MRKRKCRAWLYKEKRMVTVERLWLPKDGHCIGACNEAETIGVNYFSGEHEDIFELMDFSGKECYGDEIFEKDYLVYRDTYEEDCRHCQVYTVEFVDGCWWLINGNCKEERLYDIDEDDYYVVGNIFQGLKPQFQMICSI